MPKLEIHEGAIIRRRPMRPLGTEIGVPIGVGLHVDQPGFLHFRKLLPCQRIGGVRNHGRVDKQRYVQMAPQNNWIELREDRDIAVVHRDNDSLGGGGWPGSAEPCGYRL